MGSRSLPWLDTLRNRLRLLMDEPVERQLPRRSRKPPIGTHVVHIREELGLMVQAGMSDELWQWLMEQGWRVETYRPDRRAYRDIPASYVTRLIDAERAQRHGLMATAMLNARSKAGLQQRG
jgi:hypothetical protein